MEMKFIQRGYPKTLVRKHRTRVEGLDRPNLLTGPQTNGNPERIPFVSMFNDLSTEITHIVRKHWTNLQHSFAGIPVFQHPPLCPTKEQLTSG